MQIGEDDIKLKLSSLVKFWNWIKFWEVNNKGKYIFKELSLEFS